MDYAVVSYWIGEAGEAEVWTYPTEEDAIDGLQRLWEQSFNLACEDDNFDEDNSYHEDWVAVVAWTDDLRRYFEVVKINKTEKLV